MQTSQADLDRVRGLIEGVMAGRGLTWAVFGRQERTAQRFLAGEKVRRASLAQLQSALGIGGLTFYFVERGLWPQALDQANDDDVRAVIESLIPRFERRRNPR